MTTEWTDGFPDHMPMEAQGGLTGNRRYRKALLGQLSTSEKLVLQVEFTVFAKTTGAWKTMWRDAIAADITPAEAVVG